MKFTFRKLSALLLALLLVCSLCVNAFADEEPCESNFDTKELGEANVEFGVRVWYNRAQAYGLIGADDAATLETIDYNASIGLSYTYCRDDIIRPSNYITNYISDTFNKTENGRAFSLSTETLGVFNSYADYMMIEATANCHIEVWDPNTYSNSGYDPITAYFL